MALNSASSACWNIFCNSYIYLNLLDKYLEVGLILSISYLKYSNCMRNWIAEFRTWVYLLQKNPVKPLLILRCPSEFSSWPITILTMLYFYFFAFLVRRVLGQLSSEEGRDQGCRLYLWPSWFWMIEGLLIKIQDFELAMDTNNAGCDDIDEDAVKGFFIAIFYVGVEVHSRCIFICSWEFRSHRNTAQFFWIQLELQLSTSRDDSCQSCSTCRQKTLLGR